jgi:Rha family phage regulatory protein
MMMEMVQLPESAVFLHDGHAVTTSLKVAEIFGKQHKNVLRDIGKIVSGDEGGRLKTEPSSNDCGEFWRLNFEPRNYVDERGKDQPMYEITKDGFTFLAMGFTGEKATQFKIAYINRFNEMEATLMQAYAQPAVQVENYWFARRPHWPPIRARVLLGEAYRNIADALQMSRGRVARAVKSMIKVGLLDPHKVAEVQHGPAKKAALRYGEGWGQPVQPPAQLPLFG